MWSCRPFPGRAPVLWTDARVAAWHATGTRPAVAVWTARQTAAFLRCCAGDPLYPLYHLIACRGLRRGEAAGLTWPDIDLDAATLTVSQQLLDEDGKLLFGPPKSQTSLRTMPLDRRTVSVLRRHQEAQRSRSQDGALWPWADLVFTRADGRPLRPEYITRHFQRLARDGGLPPIRLHGLRHGAASLALAAGADLKVVQDLLGHSSIVLTADTYITVLPELARQAAEGVAALVLASAGRPPGQRPHARLVPPGRTVATSPPAKITSRTRKARSGRVGRLGLEPRTHGLKVRCSTIELTPRGARQGRVHGTKRTDFRRGRAVAMAVPGSPPGPALQ
jgi:hypothetical protein